MRSFNPQRIPATWTVLVFIGSVYLGQLMIAGSIANDAATSSVYQLSDVGFIVFNPWMHSGHSHIFWNVMSFSLLGWWTERKIGTIPFIGVAVIAGYITNLVPLSAGFGGHTVGISGITNMLWTVLMLTQLLQFLKSFNDPSISTSKTVGHVALFMGIFGLFVGQSVAQFFGYMPAPDGAAKGAHFLGVVLGIIWFMYYLSNLTVRNLFQIQAS